MPARIDIQREIHEGRIKARRDERMRLDHMLKQGRAEGAVLGRIELTQKVLRRELTPRVELEAKPLDELERLAAELERQLFA